MNTLELKVPPPIVALLIGVAMWFCSRLGAAFDVPFLVRTSAFVAFGLVGGATALAGDLEFKRAKTTINPLKPQNTTALVTSGIYRYTRNPMYVGLTLVLFGWTLFLCSTWAIAGPVVFVLYIGRFQIEPEEKILAAKFGAAYSEYASRVRRWL